MPMPMGMRGPSEKVPGGTVHRRFDPHRCPTPPERSYNPGDIFECDACRRQWILDDDQRDGLFWRAQ